MERSPNLDLPFIIAAQAQKHVTHNEALLALDVLLHCAVEDRTRNAPPASPSDGQRHLIAAPAAGDWETHDGEIAAFQDGAWSFYTPVAGMVVFVKTESILLLHDGEVFRAPMARTPLLGVNAEANASRPLTVAGDRTLLTHDGSGHQLTVNKAAATDTASLLLQHGFSGRAEIGLNGDDALSVKTSDDGATWRTAMRVDPASGAVRFPVGIDFADYWRFWREDAAIVTGTPVAPLVWDTAGPNPGGAYDMTTGGFTAPTAGFYLVNASFTSNAGDLLSVDAEVNGVAVARAQIYPVNWTIIDRTFLIRMEAGDVLRFWVKAGSSTYLGAPGAVDGISIVKMGH